MTESLTEQQRWLAQFYQEDATDRLRHQQEFSVSGFKTLILINGGAIIALLTYIGNAHDKLAAANLNGAFVGYVAGLVLAVAAYLPAYFAQSQIMLFSASIAFTAMGVEAPNKELQEKRLRNSNRLISLSVILCVGSLAFFVGGSWSAMRGIS